MRHLAMGAVLAVSVFSAAQTTTSVQPSKDPQAVAVMKSCLTASGGAQALSMVQDFTASGTATFNWDTPTPAAATLKGRIATNQFRFDASLASGTRSWAVNNGAGVLVDIDQTRTVLRSQTAMGLRNLALPVADFVSALSDPNAAVSLVSNGATIHIHVQEVYSSSLDPSGRLSASTARDYYVDPTTSLIVSISNTQSFGSSGQSLVETISFSQYTGVNGLVVPFSVSEAVGGQQTWTMQLTNIVFNTGLTDADFQL